MTATRTAPSVLRLCLWCAAAVAVEAVLYASYRGHDASFHWLTHFFVGGSVALLLMSAWSARRRRPVPRPILWVLAGHVYAMVPDLLFRAGIAHEQWMDAFLGHVSSHEVPGRNLTWYAVFLGCLALYAVTVHAGAAVALPRSGPAS